MLTLALRTVRHNIGRYVATVVAIVTGVAFFAATGFVSDGVIRALEGDVDRQYGAVDVAIVVDDSDSERSSSEWASGLMIGGSVAEEVAALPGVGAVGGDLTGAVAFLGADGRPYADDATGRLWIADEELNPIDVADGAAPVAADEIAVDEGLADREGLAVGDTVTILTLAGDSEVRVVGITEFGDSEAQDPGGTVSLPEASAFDWLNSGHVEYEDLYVRGSVTEEELLAGVEPLAPDGFVAVTGDEIRADKRSEVGGFGRVLKTSLQSFAVLALLVGGFVIYNTFSVIVAQRVRELAVLSAIGATPRQLRRALRFEGLAIGVIGSALGIVAGGLLALLLIFVLGVSGVSLSGGGLVVSPSVVIQSLLAGTLITLISVTVPARRAARTEPIEALRQAAAETPRVSRRRVVATLVLTGLAIAGMLQGQGVRVAVGALLLFVAAIVAGPLIALGGSRVLRSVLAAFGLEGRLAVDNIGRNPSRTATTANALLIGVFLVTLVTVGGTSVKDFAVNEINELSTADYTIASDGGTVDDQLVADLLAIDDVEVVVPFRRESVTQDGEASVLATGDIAAITEAASIDLIAGSFDDLAPGTILLHEVGALGNGDDVEAEAVARIGTEVTLVDSAGDRVELEVVGVVENSIDTLLTGSFVDEETFDGFVGDTAPTMAFVNVATGAESDTEDEIEALTDLRPDITLTRGNALGQLVGTIFDFMIGAVNGLLLMSVVIALIGIVNTLSLSILERRRELGLLRVVGMLDRRVHRMVRLEAVIISLLGTVTGVALGLFTGWALVFTIDRSTDADVALSFPGLLLVGVLVAGVALGFLASLIPASRSTRLDVLDAIDAP